MIQDCFLIFRPINKWGNDDVKRHSICYDTQYIHSVELVKLNKHWVYRIYRDDGMVIYINVKQYRFTFGVNKYEKR